MKSSQTDAALIEALAAVRERVIAASVAAGRAIYEISKDIGTVADKADGSPLTRADMAAHRIIAGVLADLAPELPLLSEEGDHGPFVGGSIQRFWCVDPLDGTKEFVKGLDEYTVNIAVIDAGRSVFGVIYVPATGAVYHALAGRGAFRRSGVDGSDASIAAVRRARPASAVASRSHLDARTAGFIERLGCGEIIRSGSSLKMCAVAEGRSDVYPRFGPTCLWDTAAGAAICIEAGCDVLALDGETPLSYDPADGGLKREGFLVLPTGAAWSGAVKAALAGG